MDRKPYSDAAKHVDEPSLITDAERAALNHKFEYHKAKKLRAAEAQAQMRNAPHALNEDPHALRFYDKSAMSPLERGTQIHAHMEQALNAIIADSEYGRLGKRPSILKLALSLTARAVLVIGIAVLVLAMVTK